MSYVALRWVLSVTTCCTIYKKSIKKLNKLLFTFVYQLYSYTGTELVIGCILCLQKLGEKNIENNSIKQFSLPMHNKHEPLLMVASNGIGLVLVTFIYQIIGILYYKTQFSKINQLLNENIISELCLIGLGFISWLIKPRHNSYKHRNFIQKSSIEWMQ